MYDKEIDRVGTGCKDDSFKFVGINLDENITWSYHIKEHKKQDITAVYALAKVRNLLSNNIKLTIYNSLFRSSRIWNILLGQKCMS